MEEECDHIPPPHCQTMIVSTDFYFILISLIVPAIKSVTRRNTEGSAPRRHTDTDTDRISRIRDRDPRKRWSNLEERSEVIRRNIEELDGKRNPKLATLVKV